MKIRDAYDTYDFNGVKNATFSADGKFVATIDETRSSGQLNLWDGKTGKFVRNVALTPHVNYDCIEFARTGRILAVAGKRDRLVGGRLTGGRPQTFLGLIDAGTGAILRRFTLAADDHYSINQIRFSTDGKTLATTGEVIDGDGKASSGNNRRIGETITTLHAVRNLRFWDVQLGSVRSTLPLQENAAWPVEFVNNEICAVIGASGVEFWNIARSQLLGRLTILALNRTGNGFAVEWLVETPDGRFDYSPLALPYLRWRVGGKLQSTPPSGAVRTAGLLQSELNLDL
jgi:WD40 repeat protein